MLELSNDVRSTFSELLLRSRRIAGLTQEELADRAGLSVRGLRKIERGDIQRPYRRTVEMLVSALELESESVEARQLFRARNSIPADGDRSPECPVVDGPVVDGNDSEHGRRPVEAGGCVSGDEDDPPLRFMRQAVEGRGSNQPYLDFPWL